ncbi:MAG: ester cyclase [Verrucomicrobiales bacterium]|nr:ester cyclase [Verrucomicrobiales bacterium]
MQQTPSSRRPPRWLWIAPLILTLLSSTAAHAELISDFNDGVPDWDSLGVGFGTASFEEAEGHLAIEITGGNTVAATWNRNVELVEGARTEVRVDLVAHDGGGAMLGFKGLREPQLEVGYYAMLYQNWIAVIEYQLPLDGPYSPEWGFVIPQVSGLSHLDVTYGLALTKSGDGVEITLSVWDRTPERNLLFTQTALDSVNSGGGSLDQPFLAFSGIFVGMVDPPFFPQRLVVDNLELEVGPSPLLQVRKVDPGSVEVSWPSWSIGRYRLYRSLNDLEHFFPFGDILKGNGGTLSHLDEISMARSAFYKYTQPPASESAARLVTYYQRFREMVVNPHNPSRIPVVCSRDMCFDDVATLNPRNRAEMQEDFTGLFASFPDYRMTGDRILTAANLATAEAVVTGTHSGDWDTGTLGVVPATGNPVTIRQLGVLDFEGDMMVRYRVYQDLMEPLIQIGAIPMPEVPPLVPSIAMPVPNPTGLSPMETVTETTARWNASDLAGYIEAFAEDADPALPGVPPGMTRVEYAAAQEGFFIAFPDHHMETERQLDLGDGWVLVEALWTGTHTGPYMGAPASNNPVDLRGAILARVDEAGLVTYFHVYFDNLTLLGQMGMLTPPAP